MSDTAIVCFRRDLRLADNPALSAALSRHERVLPVYIHAGTDSSDPEHGAASHWWLHHSLKSLAASLRERGSRLIVRSNGAYLDLLMQLVEQSGAGSVYWNRLYEPHAVQRDSTVKQALRDRGIEVESFNSALFHEPWQVHKADGEPFRVFTPYWKACIKSGLAGARHEMPERLPAVSSRIKSERIESLALLPKIQWYRAFSDYWEPGETGAHRRVDEFLDTALRNYQDDRNRPDRDGTSRLSPHLHFGEISPGQVLDRTLYTVNLDSDRGLVAQSEAFIRELGWREFACHLLYHFPHTVDKPLYERFERFPWEKRYARGLRAWQTGQTGIPIVDAGMRELWQTGWMHNRVRMIVASLLTKNMLIPWQEGAHWFRDTLVDADLASNTLGWQWTAGCGADAAPYFRIFNPVTQAEKFDPEGAYIRRWVPEIAALPNKYLAQPWAAPAGVLEDCGIRPGKDYSKPVVDLKATRERALERYNTIRKYS